ncbi:MAG: GlsB/YeaQ/YmgE family stress response membrane protein [Gammaproteobacteria bacterium]|nr:GlsB/YeaQ/YmgE family stress response membrane protein [Gammaproteobacteria bacterium]
MGVLSWIVFGLIAGLIGRVIMPGRDPGGFIVTTAIGILGAVIGGFVGTQLGWGEVTGFDLRSLGIAVVGAVLLLAVFRLLRR